MLTMALVGLLLVAGGCASARSGANAKTMGNAPKETGPSLYTIDIGDPELKKHTVDMREGEIVDAATGRTIEFEAMIEQLAKADVVFLGESHTSMSIHKWQDRIIRALHAKGVDLKIGMEFFQREVDDHLASWVKGWLTERGLMYLTGWYATGGYNFGYYRPFISFARDAGIPVFGANVPRMIIRTISRQGFDALSPEQKAEIGDVDTSNKDHQTLIKAYFGGADMGHGQGGIPEEQFMRMYSAQRTWDTVFANSAITAHEDWNGTVVIIVGSGHLGYNLGSSLILEKSSDLKAMTVMPVIMTDSGMRRVKRSYGDILIGVPEDSNPAHYPSFGVSGSDKDGAVVVGMLFPNSEAFKAGMKAGDVLVALDGKPIKDATDMRIRLAAKSWGDTAVFTVKRGDEEVTVEITPKREE